MKRTTNIPSHRRVNSYSKNNLTQLKLANTQAHLTVTETPKYSLRAAALHSQQLLKSGQKSKVSELSQQTLPGKIVHKRIHSDISNTKSYLDISRAKRSFKSLPKEKPSKKPIERHTEKPFENISESHSQSYLQRPIEKSPGKNSKALFEHASKKQSEKNLAITSEQTFDKILDNNIEKILEKHLIQHFVGITDKLEEAASKPSQTIANIIKSLNVYERREALNYKEIYFTGQNKILPNMSGTSNYGFDDERGDYNLVVSDHIAYRYEVLSLLGSGSFGMVVKVLDHKTKAQMALKIIKNKQRFHQQAAVEIKVLRSLKHSDLCVKIHDYFSFRHHVCIVFELLHMTLYEFIKKKNLSQMSNKLIRSFAVQILQALSTQRSLKIIHCDLKPENIMLSKKNSLDLKVIDYGSACFESQKIYTYIQSRFYRAPEVILGAEYSSMIDMWSFGCILAELYMGTPLFPGECENEQLSYMMEVLGVPSPSLVLRGRKAKQFFIGERPVPYTNKRGKRRLPGAKCLEDLLLNANPYFVDLVRACLEWDPEKRITPDKALCHQWVTKGKKSYFRKNSIQPLQKKNKNYHSYKASLDEEQMPNIANPAFVSKMP